MSTLIAKEYKSFKAIKHVSDDGAEFWYARELAPVLEYAQWRNFIKVLGRAILACKNSGYSITDHFAEVSKTIKMPKTATKRVVDFKLTRYACYLIVQIFKEGELDEKLVCRYFRHTTQHGAIEGKTQSKDVAYYNLDVIISVGYRVKSHRTNYSGQYRYAEKAIA